MLARGYHADVPMLSFMEFKEACYYSPWSRSSSNHCHRDSPPSVCSKKPKRMIAGRVWWLNYKIQKTFQLADQTAKNSSQNLLGPILESGALTPIFLLLWMALNFSSLSSLFMSFWANLITLTEIGIASTLIIVRIGLGVDALASQYHSSTTSHVDLETTIMAVQNCL
ncbi:hypothetical protein BT96DRAFT_88417 [Gymnopus androsaceus JB14]|uniref:Uncharacterized protein n=1 Tax=Gymnopus androsaceus JB14 TaxID=1447944 RepID=A0A6A4HH87_9AGAR|nr:hypothetical protein BT96DRAFT_88417 [Gymnopus androsaceus JB14]